MPRPPQYLFPDGASFGADNVVLHARAKRHTVTDFPGPLSIKTVVHGAVPWIVRGRTLVVDPSSFLVLGDGEKYSMDFESPYAMETACAFFKRGFVERVAEDATTPVEAALDDPEREAAALPSISRLHVDRDGTIVGRLQSLAKRCRVELQPSSFEEDFLLLSHALLTFYDHINTQMARVPAAKAATREELFRRLERGREFIHGHADGPLSLDTVAKEACLSPFHFHRVFTQVYQKTPHGYITDVRLARARSLIESGRPVAEACVDVGFSSTTSFTRLFRARYGAPPSKLRRAAK